MSADLTTRYLGLRLTCPLVAAASPMTDRLDGLRRLQDAGIGAVVLPSLFEEAIAEQEMGFHRWKEFGGESFGEAASYVPDIDTPAASADVALHKVEAAKKALFVPVIASLNGCTAGGWAAYARRFQDAGADALELNVYFLATDAEESGADVENRTVDLVAAVRAETTLPLAVKLGPYYSSLPHLARRLELAGADGLVLFNRFLQPDIDLELLEVAPHLVLSSSVELRLPLRWIAILRGQLQLSLCGNSGAHTAADVAKLLLAGADTAMMASVLLQKGPEHVAELRRGLSEWLDAHEYESVAQMRGSLSQANCPNPAAFERANYVRTLASYSGPWRW